MNKREGMPTPDQFDALDGSHRVLYRLKMALPTRANPDIDIDNGNGNGNDQDDAPFSHG